MRWGDTAVRLYTSSASSTPLATPLQRRFNGGSGPFSPRNFTDFPAHSQRFSPAALASLSLLRNPGFPESGNLVTIPVVNLKHGPGTPDRGASRALRAQPGRPAGRE